MADLAAVVATEVETAETVVVALAEATLAETARVVGLIAHLAQADHATVAHQTPKNADGGSHRLI
jgi:hypothetical protein